MCLIKYKWGKMVYLCNYCCFDIGLAQKTTDRHPVKNLCIKLFFSTIAPAFG